MPTNHPRQPHRLTRRRAAALGGGLMLGAGAVQNAFAQSTPAASTVPANGYARPELLVNADWLNDRFGDPDILAVALMPLDAFEGTHIPGSLQIDWPELEVTDTSDASIQSWQQQVEEQIGDLGINRDTTVVVYDDGTLFAARLWWIFHWLGHERVHILDGGLPAWQEAGYETETGPVVRTLIEHPPYDGQPNDDALAQKDEVLNALDDPNTVIIDARSPNEYADGHILGAVNVNYPRNAASTEPPYWRPADELRALYESIGVTPDSWVIPYCSTGVRSAVTTFTLYLLGYDISLYTGSWAEWSAASDAPRETGN